MTDQDLIANLIRRNATMRTLARDVIQAHESNKSDKLDESVFALKEYLKAPVTKPGASERFIRLWRFEDAPVEYRALSTCGGDEDWVALIPAELRDGMPWEDDVYTSGLGWRHRYELDTGELVLIFAHS